MTFWKTQAFIALQEAWYQRLEAEGFKDAEETVAGELVLRQIAAHPYRGTEPLERETKERYFRFLAQQVQEAEFKSEVDRIILIKHAEGEKIKRICEELNKQGQARCRGTIRFTIRKYEMRWGLRQYTAKQLNKKVS